MFFAAVPVLISLLSCIKDKVDEFASSIFPDQVIYYILISVAM